MTRENEIRVDKLIEQVQAIDWVLRVAVPRLRGDLRSLLPIDFHDQWRPLQKLSGSLIKFRQDLIDQLNQEFWEEGQTFSDEHKAIYKLREQDLNRPGGGKVKAEKSRQLRTRDPV